MKLQLHKNNIELVRKYKKAPHVNVNREEMKQVFLNLIVNARDSMSAERGRLEIRVERVKKHVGVCFSDTGMGIEKEDLNKVFEPFCTTKEALGGNEGISGTGLGLYVFYGVVQSHGGTIEVEREGGKGRVEEIGIKYAAI